MSFSSQNDFDRNTGAIEAEKTLRLIATLPAPKGIEERVKAKLRTAPQQGQVIVWPSAPAGGWLHSSAMRAAAAAAIVIVVAGGGWEVYSHIRVAPEPAAIASPPQISGQTGFSTAEARRTPKTVDGPTIAVPVTIKQKTEKSAAASQIAGHHATVKKPKATAAAER